MEVSTHGRGIAKASRVGAGSKLKSYCQEQRQSTDTKQRPVGLVFSTTKWTDSNWLIRGSCATTKHQENPQKPVQKQQIKGQVSLQL